MVPSIVVTVMVTLRTGMVVVVAAVVFAMPVVSMVTAVMVAIVMSVTMTAAVFAMPPAPVMLMPIVTAHGYIAGMMLNVGIVINRGDIVWIPLAIADAETVCLGKRCQHQQTGKT